MCIRCYVALENPKLDQNPIDIKMTMLLIHTHTSTRRRSHELQILHLSFLLAEIFVLPSLLHFLQTPCFSLSAHDIHCSLHGVCFQPAQLLNPRDAVLSPSVAGPRVNNSNSLIRSLRLARVQ